MRLWAVSWTDKDGKVNTRVYEDGEEAFGLREYVERQGFMAFAWEM